MYLLHLLNGFAGQSETLDKIVVTLTNLPLFKMSPFVVAYCWLWFAEPRGAVLPALDQQRRQRRLIFSAIGAAIVACGVSQLIQITVGERPRPLHEPSLLINRPFGLEEGYGEDYSSFPSDNASITFALAAGLLFVSRPVGTFALLWALVIACVPRIFAGFHYPSDIIGGALLGAATAWAVIRFDLLARPFELAMRVLDRNQGAFYGAAFLVMYSVMTFFVDAWVLVRRSAAFVSAAL